MSEQVMPEHIRANIQRMVQAQYEAEGAPFVELGKAIKARVDEHQAMIQELTQKVVATDGALPRSAAKGQGMGTKLRDAVAGDNAFEHLKSWNQGTCRAELPGLSLRAALVNEGYDPAPTTNTAIPGQPERGGIVGPVIPQPRLLNFLRTREVQSDSVEYVQLSTSGDVGYQMGEGAEKAEVEFEGVKRRASIQTIAGHTTASRQVLSDHATLAQHIDGVLRAKLLNKLCYEIINGQGDSGDELRIEGLIKQATVMALPTATTFADLVGEAIVRQGNLGFTPGLVVVNPQSWFKEIATAKTATEQAYLFGSPASPLPPALWNLPVALEPSMPAGSALVLDLNFITVLDRERVSVLLSNSHKDNFTKNLVTILGELRAGLEVLDQGAVFLVEPTSGS